jgi:Ca2+-binding RTX toxin-like protein
MTSDTERTDMNRIAKHLLLLAATATALVVAAIGAPNASAAPNCSYAGGTANVALSDGESAWFKRGPSGELLFNGAQCGSATIENTNLVQVTGSPGSNYATIDLSGGPLWNKIFGQINQIHEVHFNIDLGDGWDTMGIKGDPMAPNHIVAGANGVDLNPDQLWSGVDVVPTGVAKLTITGGDGNDTLSASGNAITGGPLTVPNPALIGGVGNDTLSGDKWSDLTGGPDDDTLTGSGEFSLADFVQAPGPVTVDLGAGTATGDGNDTLVGIGEVQGSKYDDTITGDSSPNLLFGGDGADTIYGLGGDDQISGNAGDDYLYGGDGNDLYWTGPGNDLMAGGDGVSDKVSYSASPGPVSVDLAAGTASGDGSDTLSGIEGIYGSSHDDLIQGSGGNDTLYGENGNDVLIPRGGDDQVYGNAGTDTVAFDGSPQGVDVDVAYQKANGEGSDFISNDVENVRGSSHDDVISGSGVANVLQGMGGNDSLIGAGGDDTLDGGAGSDTAAYDNAPAAVNVNLSTGKVAGEGNDSLAAIETVHGSAFGDKLVGGPGADTLLGLGGNDTIEGAGGNDILDGGAGSDLLSYTGSPAGVDVNLATGKASGGEGNDTLGGFELVNGSAFADKLSGGGGNDWLAGLGGNDILAGGGGNDHLDGGAGIDTLSYEAAPNGVNVSLAAGNALGQGTDVLTGFETVRGSKFADTIAGGPANETIFGLGGNDKLDGGAGSDTVAYDSSPAGVNVNLASGSATGEGSDSLSHFETVRGSAFGDQLIGGPGPDVLLGLGGNDTIAGAGGDDKVDGGAGSDTVSYESAPAGVKVDLGSSSASGDGNDALSGFETVRGSAFGDQLTGGPGADSVFGLAGNDLLVGAGGNDVLDGGVGRDFVGYAQANGPVHVDLGKNVASGADGSDSLASIESAIGSPFKDVLIGSKLGNILKGGAGKDLLEGGAGSDRLYGEAGADSLHGGTGNDLLSGAAGKPDTCKQDQGHGKRIGCERR